MLLLQGVYICTANRQKEVLDFRHRHWRPQLDPHCRV